MKVFEEQQRKLDDHRKEKKQLSTSFEILNDKLEKLKNQKTQSESEKQNIMKEFSSLRDKQERLKSLIDSDQAKYDRTWRLLKNQIEEFHRQEQLKRGTNSQSEPNGDSLPSRKVSQ